jgi:hypothetical protein
MEMILNMENDPLISISDLIDHRLIEMNDNQIKKMMDEYGNDFISGFPKSMNDGLMIRNSIDLIRIDNPYPYYPEIIFNGIIISIHNDHIKIYDQIKNESKWMKIKNIRFSIKSIRNELNQWKSENPESSFKFNGSK